MQRARACLAAAGLLTACGNPMGLLTPVNDARAAVKQRLGADWNITLEIVEHSGKPDAYVCGYTQPPRDPDAKTPAPLSDDHLFIWRDGKLTLADDVGKTALADEVDKDCPGMMHMKTIEPRHIDMTPLNTVDLSK